MTAVAAATLWLILLAPRLLVPLPSDVSLRNITNPVTRQQLVDERLTLQNDVRTTLLQGVGGAILLLGAYFTLRQFQLNQEGQITERFTRAIDQLGNEKLAVRVGGISALGRIARDSAKDHEPVMETLAAFVREQSNELRRGEEVIPVNRTPPLRGDLQAAATILGYRPESRRREESRRISLRGASLGRAHLRDAHYEGIALTRADFRIGTLTGIHLNGSLLREALFEKTMLEEAHLTGAFLVGADLRYARLGGADFEGAWLFGANLEGVQLNHVRIEGAYYDSEPVVNWLQEMLGASPWKWSALREQLDTPSDAALHAIQSRLSRPAGQPIGKEQVREALRQIEFLVEKELNPSDTEGIQDVRFAQALRVRGIDPDASVPEAS
jgi:hypothetical protein